MGTSTPIYVSQVLRISDTLGLNSKNYCVHILRCSSLCNFFRVSHYIFKFTAKYFLQQPQHLWHHYCEGVASHKSASNIELEVFSHTQTWLYTGWFVNFGHYCRIKVIFSVLMVPYIFNSSEYITVNGPSDIMEFPIKCFKNCSLSIKSSLCYEVKFKIIFII